MLRFGPPRRCNTLLLQCGMVLMKMNSTRVTRCESQFSWIDPPLGSGLFPFIAAVCRQVACTHVACSFMEQVVTSSVQRRHDEAWPAPDG